MPYRRVLCPCSVSAALWHIVAGSLAQCWVCNGDNYGMELETPVHVVLLAGEAAAVSDGRCLTPLLAFLLPAASWRN